MTIAGDLHMSVADAWHETDQLLAEHHLDGWHVRFNQAKRVAGSCSYPSRTITLSRYLLARRSWADSMNTITHEIAHALTPGHHHDRVWVAQHRELGGDGLRCHSFVDDSAPWLGVCAHGVRFVRYRAPRPGLGYRCRCRPASPVVFERVR
ncbi:MAG TPA: SprT-like domain-containing protein [Mycobacterium sp.]|nr:SprT-like domain-containing protein [Mycobacterium sp.]